MTMKIILKLNDRSHRYDTNRSRTGHGHKRIKYKICLSIMMVMCIKQRLSNIWSSIHGNVRQQWGWFKGKSCLYKNFPYTREYSWHIEPYWAILRNLGYLVTFCFSHIQLIPNVTQNIRVDSSIFRFVLI